MNPLKSPRHIAATIPRPEIILASEATKINVGADCDKAHKRKRTSKAGRRDVCRLRLASEDFAGQPLYKALRALGITGIQWRGAIRDTTAEKASRWLWIRT